jgi:multidrug efflux pump
MFVLGLVSGITMSIGDIDAYGSQYSMRIWLDPAKLNAVQMTAKDVTDAIESQNAQIAVGQLGGTPSIDKQALNATINSQSLLQTPQQFRDITLRVNQDGSEVRLGDVADIEMGAEKYDYLSRFNGNAASGLGVKLASGANEMATAKLVIDRLDELSHFFPHGKSTLLRMIAGLETITSGDLLIGDTRMNDVPPAERAVRRNAHPG